MKLLLVRMGGNIRGTIGFLDDLISDKHGVVILSSRYKGARKTAERIKNTLDVEKEIVPWLDLNKTNGNGSFGYQIIRQLSVYCAEHEDWNIETIIVVSGGREIEYIINAYYQRFSIKTTRPKTVIDKASVHRVKTMDCTKSKSRQKIRKIFS